MGSDIYIEWKKKLILRRSTQHSNNIPIWYWKLAQKFCWSQNTKAVLVPAPRLWWQWRVIEPVAMNQSSLKEVAPSVVKRDTQSITKNSKTPYRF